MTLARWSAHERLALVTASRVSASLSIIGAAFVLFAGAFASRFARGRTFIFVRRIACADFGFALAAIFGDLGISRPLDRPSAACVTQGIFIQTFGVAGAMWSAVVAKELRDAGRGALASSQVYLASSFARWLREGKVDGAGRPFGEVKDEEPTLRKHFTRAQLEAILAFGDEAE